MGPEKLFDVLVIAPCTGATLARLASGLTDTAVTMAAKSHLRNGRPVVIALSTNDALSGSAENIAALLNRMTSLTGGASGFTGIPRKTTLTIAAVSAVLAIALVAFFKSSKYGRQCIALRGDELAAKAMGINVIRIKMTAFLLSVALTAYSGCLYAFYMSYVDPTGFGWKKSADWVIMVFFGGVNSLTGSTLGAFILSALPQVLRGLQNYRYVIYAVLVLLIINFKPSGLLGEWEFTPRDIARSARKLKRKLGLKKEEN